MSISEVVPVLYALMFYVKCTFQVSHEDDEKSLSERKERTRGEYFQQDNKHAIIKLS